MRAFAKRRLLVTALAFLSSYCVLQAQDQQDKTSDAVYRLGDDLTAPRPVYTPNPEYSDKARREKINGVVVVAMIVTEGKVRDVKVKLSKA
jgi:hypothetical protein